MENKALHFLAFSLGFLLLFHGIDKMIQGVGYIEELFIDSVMPYNQYRMPFCACFNYGVNSMENMLVSYTLPYTKQVIYGVYVAEVVAPIFLIFGRYIKIASVIIAINMLIGMFLVYRDTFFILGKGGSWSVEVPMLYLLIAVTLVLGKEKRRP
jgi:putative oxidoreductase